jgi:hypothetical protein
MRTKQPSRETWPNKLDSSCRISGIEQLLQDLRYRAAAAGFQGIEQQLQDLRYRAAAAGSQV